MHYNQKNVINANKCLEEGSINLIANKLNSLLDAHNTSTKILSEATGISIALINNLKRGEGNPTIGTLNAICNFFNISLSELLGLDDISSNSQRNISPIPIFDLRFCHKRSDANSEDKILIEPPKNVTPDSLFGVVINNSSLLPIYEKGTIFILVNNQIPVDGDIALVRIQDRSNALKRIFLKKNKYFLKNLNLDDTIDSYAEDDVQIAGIVIQIIQKIT